MRVIRYKGGYVIRCSNVEWGLLQEVASEGIDPLFDYEDNDRIPQLTKAERAILTQIKNGNRPFLQITEDRRK